MSQLLTEHAGPTTGIRTEGKLVMTVAAVQRSTRALVALVVGGDEDLCVVQFNRTRGETK